MPSKKVLAIVGGLIVVAGLVIISDYFRDRPVIDDPRIGTSLISDDTAAKTNKIVLTKGGQSVTLNRDDNGRWMVTGDVPFPASGKSVSTFLDALSTAKFIRLISSAKEKADALEVNKGDKVALFDHDKLLSEIKLGKPRQVSGEGQFVSFAGEDKVFLIDKNQRLETTAADWELKALPDLPKDAVSKVSFFAKADSAAPDAVLSRAKKEDPMKLEGATAADQTKAGEMEAASSILTGVGFKKRMKPDAVDAGLWAGAAKAVITAFDGREIQIKIASEVKKLPPAPPPPVPTPKAGAAKMPPPAAPQPRTETNYYAMIEAKGNDSPQGDVAFLNALGKNWVFQLDEYVAKKFMKDKAAFLDKVEAKAETPNKKGAHVK